MSSNWVITAKKFLQSPHFAVVGASTSPKKFGNRVLKWYQSFGLDVTPVHPREKVINGVATVASISQLSHPSETSISVITPPKVTLRVLEEARSVGVKYIWIQPGAEDEEVKSYIQQHFTGSMPIHGGPCILVHGPTLIKEIERAASL